jgi:uncharacterized protein (TIGR02145 family)
MEWVKTNIDGSLNLLQMDGKIISLSRTVKISYGLLYNWWVVNDVNITSSDDWIVPTTVNCATLKTYVNSDGGKLKETEFVYWDYPNTGATNIYGFNGRGAGQRGADGIYSLTRLILNFGTKTLTVNPALSWCMVLSNGSSVLGYGNLTHNQGRSVRLLKTSTDLTNGQSGIYIGNDGKDYRTICINTQEWMADNLAETKYRDGSDIPEITDGTEWGTLTTGALCAYDNDWNNV